MGITKFYAKVKKDFKLRGEIAGKLYDFEVGKDYDAFVVERNIL